MARLGRSYQLPQLLPSPLVGQTNWQASAGLAGAGEITAAPAVKRGAVGALAALATTDGVGTRVALGSGTLSGLASLTAAGQIYPEATAALSGLATLAATAEVRRFASGTLPALATIAAAPVTYLAGSGALSALGTIAAVGVAYREVSGALPGVATIAADISKLNIQAAATLAGVATLSGAANLGEPAANLVGVGSTVATGVLYPGASTALAGVGGLSGVAGIREAAAAALAAQATIAADITKLPLLASATLQALATIAAGAGVKQPIAAALPGVATVSGAGGFAQLALAQLSGLGTTSGVAIAVRGAATVPSLDAAATLAASALAYRGAAAALPATASIAATAGNKMAAGGLMAALASLSGLPVVRYLGWSMQSVIGRLKVLLEPSGSSDAADSEPFIYRPGVLYVWEEDHDATDEALPGTLIHRWRATAIWTADRLDEQARGQARREVSVALDAKESAYLAILHANTQTQDWDHIQARVDHDLIRALGVRGFALRLSGYQTVEV